MMFFLRIVVSNHLTSITNGGIGCPTGEAVIRTHEKNICLHISSGVSGVGVIAAARAAAVAASRDCKPGGCC